MKFLKDFALFESEERNRFLKIPDFLDKIGIRPEKHERIINWWNEHRGDIKILYFPFSSPNPILGCFLEENIVCINSKVGSPPHIKLFISLHESRHCDQHENGIFMDGYFKTVLNDEKEEFLRAYRRLEKDANDFAINSMRTIGFEKEMNQEESRLRGNENFGNVVYGMMKHDISRFEPNDFFDLLKSQVY